MNKIEIYTKGYCPYCKRAKTTLTSLGLRFEEFDITNNKFLTKQMHERSLRTTVPQIFINDIHIGGNDDLQSALRNGSLSKALRTESDAVGNA